MNNSSLFTEQGRQHLRNRDIARRASVRPAHLANGESGVWVRVNGTFVVLSVSELHTLTERIAEAIRTADNTER